MSGYNWTADVHRVETPPPPGTASPRVIWRFIGWDYFATMKIPLRTGRLFTDRDVTKAPLVTIVNEAFARQNYGSPEAALGRRIASVSPRGTEVVEIVGVSGDVRFEAFRHAGSARNLPPARADVHVSDGVRRPHRWRPGAAGRRRKTSGLRGRCDDSRGRTADARRGPFEVARTSAPSHAAPFGVRGCRAVAHRDRRLRRGGVLGSATGARIRHPAGAGRRTQRALPARSLARAPSTPSSALPRQFRRRWR